MNATMQVLTYLKNAQIFYIATLKSDNPRMRPFGAICLYQDKLYICTNNQKDIFVQMMLHPQIELSASQEDGSSLLIVATVVYDQSTEAKEAMLNDNPDLKKIYSVDDDLFEVLYLSDVSATLSSPDGQVQQIHFYSRTI